MLNIEEYGPICQVFPTIWIVFEEGSFSGELNNLFIKIAFFNDATSAPQKNRFASPSGPAESEICPADQSRKLSAGLYTTYYVIVIKLNTVCKKEITDVVWRIYIE